MQLCEAPCVPSPNILRLGSLSAITACVKLKHCNINSSLKTCSTHLNSGVNIFLWWHHHSNMTSSSFNSRSVIHGMCTRLCMPMTGWQKKGFYTRSVAHSICLSILPMDNVYVLHKGHNVLPENFCNSLTSHHTVSAVLNSSISSFDCDNSFRTLVIMGGTAIVNANYW